MEKRELQQAVDKICDKYDVKTVPVRFTDRHLAGDAYYATYRVRGYKVNHPRYIMIGNWSMVRAHPGEVAYRLAHEVAHHVLNMKKNSLQHSGAHGRLEDDIGLAMSRMLK